MKKDYYLNKQIFKNLDDAKKMYIRGQLNIPESDNTFSFIVNNNLYKQFDLLINNIMKTYTKEQLIAAQTKYNEDVKANPDDFDFEAHINKDAAEIAEKQIDYLLSLVPEE